MKKSAKGFTLVELIVVIAIIGVLAAILVPAMVGYIKDSNVTSANSSAKVVYTAIENYAQKCYTAGNPLRPSDAGTGYGPVTITGCGSTEAPSASDYNLSASTGATGSMEDVIKKAVASTLNKDGENSVVYFSIGSNHFPSKVYWAKSASTEFVGAYPDPREDSLEGGIASATF